VALALMAAYLIGPGVGANFPVAEFTAKEAPPLIDTIINLVPYNWQNLSNSATNKEQVTESTMMI